MTDPHTYFREATATLAPDVEALVSGGLQRGRTRRRRRTTLAAVAAGAAVVVVAVGAVSVPQLLDAHSTGIAPSGPGPVETSAPNGDKAEQKRRDQRAHQEPGTLAVKPADVPAVFASIVGGSTDIDQAYPDGHGGAGAHFRWNGAYTTVILERITSGRAPLDECHYTDPDNLDVTCTRRPDGSAQGTWQERAPLVDGGVTGRGYTLYTTDGWAIDLISYNATTPKAFDYTSPEPPLSFAQLEQVATSSAWFEKR